MLKRMIRVLLRRINLYGLIWALVIVLFSLALYLAVTLPVHSNNYYTNLMRSGPPDPPKSRPVTTVAMNVSSAEYIPPVVNKVPDKVYVQPNTLTKGGSQPATTLEQIIIDAAIRYGQDPQAALRVARCESGLRLNAYNPSGATGLFQFMERTFFGNGGRNIHDAYDQADTAMKMWSEGQKKQWSCQ